MDSVLPLLLASLAGFAIVVTLTALWQSVRALLVDGGPQLGTSASPRLAERDALVQQKNALLQAIRDVRFEHELGKVSASDFERLEAQYRARARELLAQLDDQLAPFREEARKRLGASDQAPVSVEATPAAAIAGMCAKCSTANDADAVFCKKCGAQLTSEDAS